MSPTLDRTAIAGAVVVLAVVGAAAFLGVSVESGSQDPGELKHQLDEKNRSIDRYEVVVDVTIRRPNDTRNLTYRMAVDRPDRMNVTVLAPENRSGDVLLFNESGFYSYDSGDDELIKVGGRERESDLLSRLVEMAANDSSFRGRDRLEGKSGVVLRYNAGETNVSMRIGGSAPASRFASNESPRDTNISVWVDPETNLPARVRQRYTFDDRNVTVDIRLRDWRVDPEFASDRFRLEVGPDTEVKDRTNATRQYDSREALVENASMRVPDPEVPAGYRLARASSLRHDGNRTVALTYRANTTALVVGKARPTRSLVDNGTPVSVGNATGYYDTAATAAIVTWNCSGATYYVTGSVDRTTLLSVARSIDCADR